MSFPFQGHRWQVARLTLLALKKLSVKISVIPKSHSVPMWAVEWQRLDFSRLPSPERHSISLEYLAPYIAKLYLLRLWLKDY